MNLFFGREAVVPVNVPLCLAVPLCLPQAVAAGTLVFSSFIVNVDL